MVLNSPIESDRSLIISPAHSLSPQSLWPSHAPIVALGARPLSITAALPPTSTAAAAAAATGAASASATAPSSSSSSSSSSPSSSSSQSTFLFPFSSSTPTLTSFQHAPTATSVMDIDNVAEDRSRRATSVLSMDDIEAAQALEGLRSDNGQSPRASSQQFHVTNSPTSSSDLKHQSEPFLSLLTSTHPFIYTAINGSMSAYSSSKSYSQRFKSGAEFIERNIGSPVANTVGTVGRKTGVENGLRWALQRRDSASLDTNRTKRRKTNGEDSRRNGDVDVEKGLEDAELSHQMQNMSELSPSESLPPYDDLKSPSYDEANATVNSSAVENGRRQTPSTWQSRLIISTSGLGIAMSDESLRSLQYCLTWLRWANDRLGNAMLALRDTLKEREDSGNSPTTILPETVLSRRIQAVREDVLSTLKKVVSIVSKYAGGALPENAHNLVRRHLTSLPRRFHMASSSDPSPVESSAPSSDATTVGAHKVMVLTREGLDIMTQVSSVVDDTLVSAEHWCDRLGRKRSDRRNGADAQGQQDTESKAVDIQKPAVPDQIHDVEIKHPLILQNPEIQMTTIGKG